MNKKILWVITSIFLAIVLMAADSGCRVTQYTYFEDPCNPGLVVVISIRSWLDGSNSEFNAKIKYDEESMPPFAECDLPPMRITWRDDFSDFDGWLYLMHDEYNTPFLTPPLFYRDYLQA